MPTTLKLSRACLQFQQVPVVDGYGYPHLMKSLPFGGREVSAQLLSLLVSRGLDLVQEGDLAAVNSIKIKACFIASDLRQERKVGARIFYLDPGEEALNPGLALHALM